MGQCCSSKSKHSRKYRDNSKNSDNKENILQDRVVLDFYKDFIVYAIKPSCGYTYLQKQIQMFLKDPNAREFEFLMVDNQSKSISLAQAIKPFTSNEAEDKMLKILFDFKEIIIHNNNDLPFDFKDATHPINKLIENFRQKNVKPKVINILLDNNIVNRFKFVADLTVCQKFTPPVLMIDYEDISYLQQILSKATWHGSNLYIHSRKNYEGNQNKYDEYLSITNFIHLYKNPSPENNRQGQLFFDLNTADAKKQQKVLNQVSESIVGSFQQGINTLIVHENNDRQSISKVLILIYNMLINRLHIQQNDILNYWDRHLPKGIFDSFKQEYEQVEVEKQRLLLEQKPQQEEVNNKDINLTEQSNSVKIEILIEKLFIEQKYNLAEFEKGLNLIEKLLQNITSQFDKKEYRNLNKSNSNLQCLFKYQYGLKLLNTLGFLDSPENPGFLSNTIEDIAYFKSLKSDFTIASKNFQQSELYIKQSKIYYKNVQKTS